jgi:hypothetical protein
MSGDGRKNGPASALVVVEYGVGPRPALERLLAGLPCPVERVRTDLQPGSAMADPNEALEFSGYQEGLARVLRANAGAPDEPLTVVFVNDTVVGGHPPSLARLLLRRLPGLHAKGAPRLVGLRMPLNDGIAAVTGPHGYVSTWAFALCAPRATLEAVRFYGPDEVLARFDATTLPPAYRDALQRWLEPTGLFSGWYKALPGVALDDRTRQRKQLTIYLEHTLATRLAALGFETLDLGEVLPPALALWRHWLRRLDRLHVNRLKLQRRIPALWQQLTERSR